MHKCDVLENHIQQHLSAIKGSEIKCQCHNYYWMHVDTNFVLKSNNVYHDNRLSSPCHVCLRLLGSSF